MNAAALTVEVMPEVFAATLPVGVEVSRQLQPGSLNIWQGMDVTVVRNRRKGRVGRVLLKNAEETPVTGQRAQQVPDSRITFVLVLEQNQAERRLRRLEGLPDTRALPVKECNSLSRSFATDRGDRVASCKVTN